MNLESMENWMSYEKLSREELESRLFVCVGEDTSLESVKRHLKSRELLRFTLTESGAIYISEKEHSETSRANNIQEATIEGHFGQNSQGAVEVSLRSFGGRGALQDMFFEEVEGVDDFELQKIMSSKIAEYIKES
jgi:hypothetical protein